jgi:hypothetical protein
MYFKYIFNFYILNRMSDKNNVKKVKLGIFGDEQ